MARATGWCSTLLAGGVRGADCQHGTWRHPAGIRRAEQRADALPAIHRLGKSLTLKGYLYAEIVSDPAALARAKAFIADGLASGELQPIIARTFPLDEIQAAHRYLEANQQVGEVVVTA